MIVNFMEKTIDDEEAYALVLKRNRFKELILTHMEELEIERFELLYYKDKHKRTAFYLAGEHHLYSKLLNFYQNNAILLESNRYD